MVSSLRSLLLAASFATVLAPACAAPTDEAAASTDDALATSGHVGFDANGVLVVAGKPVFPIGFTLAPPADVTLPSGVNALDELRKHGANFLRTSPPDADGDWEGWDADAFARNKALMDAAAAHGFKCWAYLQEAAGPLVAGQEPKLLRRVVDSMKSHPCTTVWKGADEPEHGHVDAAGLARTRAAIRALDADHPVAIIQAPVGTLDDLLPYRDAADIFGFDIYPVAAHYGLQTDRANKTISVVGDLTRTATHLGGKSTWMTLQISWSGVKPPNKLVFPTLHEERFMAYDAIINGARGLFFFGGNNEFAWQNELDRNHRWTWTFWNDVLSHVLDQIGEHSPLAPALVAPNAAPLRIDDEGIEHVVRETPGATFVIAARKSGASGRATMCGMPNGPYPHVHALWESRWIVRGANGCMSDVFEPNDVHVYMAWR